MRTLRTRARRAIVLWYAAEMKNSCIACGGALVAACVSGGFAQTASYQVIGSFPGGVQTSEVRGVSADGRVVVGRATQGTSERAFRWTQEEGMVGLRYLPGGTAPSDARGVSADGRVIVGAAAYEAIMVPVRWVDGQIEPLGDLGGNRLGEANAVSDDGEVVVGYSRSPEGVEAFRWTAATGMAGLGDLAGGSFRSEALGVSADGEVVVGKSITREGVGQVNYGAMYWTEKTGMVGLGDLAGDAFSSSAAAISGDGRTIVGYGYGKWFGLSVAEWRDGRGPERVPSAPPFRWGSLGLDVTDDGLVIVGHGMYADYTTGAFICKPYWQMLELEAMLVDDYGLDLGGWTLTEAGGISADGTVVVGNGRNAVGMRQGWVVHLPPACPADLNRDGLVDAEDVGLFVTEMMSGDDADFNADGVVNSQDFFDFLTVFFSGC